MKTIILLLLLIPAMCFAGDNADIWSNQIIFNWTETDSFLYNEKPTILLNVIILLELWDKYAQECYVDTIKATAIENDYLISYDNYREWVTEKQLKERGYKYRYRLVIKTFPLVFKYIFIKEPTFAGFIEYLRREQGEQ